MEPHYVVILLFICNWVRPRWRHSVPVVGETGSENHKSSTAAIEPGGDQGVKDSFEATK